MQTATCWIIAAMMTTGITVGQQKSDDQVKVLTVCEVLGDVTHHADTAVAVVGRMERSVSRIDHYEFLAQDRCEHPVVTHGHVWSDKVQIWFRSGLLGKRGCRSHRVTGRNSNGQPSPQSYAFSFRPTTHRRINLRSCTGGLYEFRTSTKIVVPKAAVETTFHW